MSTRLERWAMFFESGIYQDGWTWRDTDEKTNKEVEAVIRLLNPAPGSHILDWCGGWGRHAIELAKRGFKVTLLDFAKRHIGLARKFAREQGVELNLLREDFRLTPSSIQADYAINMFTAGLGYLTEEDDLKALKSLYSALKPRAKILIDTMNLFWLVKNYNHNDWHEIQDGKARIFETREFNYYTNRNYSQGILWEEGKPERSFTLSHRIYSGAELVSLASTAGFRCETLYGDFDGSDLGFDSKRIILVAQKS